MRWIKVNEVPCPGCGRTGDSGQRNRDLCWRCNLPARLDAAQHGRFIDRLQVEHDGLLDAREEIKNLSEAECRRHYGGSRAAGLRQVELMLWRCERDLQDLGALIERESPCAA